MLVTDNYVHIRNRAQTRDILHNMCHTVVKMCCILYRDKSGSNNNEKKTIRKYIFTNADTFRFHAYIYVAENETKIFLH